MGKQLHKTMLWWLVVAGLTAVFAAVVLPVQAGLINMDTGEVYQPGFDEDGNFEEPPEWVAGDEPPFQSETVTKEDICDTSLSLWTCDDVQISVSSALGMPQTRQALLSELVESFNSVMDAFEFEKRDKDGKVVSSQTFFSAVVEEFECNGCTYTYAECLLDGYPWDWCKKHWLTCNPGNSVTVTVPAQGTTTVLGTPVSVSGSVTIEGSIDVREITIESGAIIQVVCIAVESFTVNGFGVVNSIVQNQIDSLLVSQDGTFCTSLGGCE